MHDRPLGSVLQDKKREAPWKIGLTMHYCTLHVKVHSARASGGTSAGFACEKDLGFPLNFESASGEQSE